MRKVEEIKIHVDPRVNEDAKNLDGSQGAKCNNCGGYGFTLGLKGSRMPCKDCKESGAREMTLPELQKEVISLKNDLKLFRQALREDLGFKGMKEPTIMKETNYV